jgi:hypothetical protein
VKLVYYPKCNDIDQLSGKRSVLKVEECEWIWCITPSVTTFISLVDSYMFQKLRNLSGFGVLPQV